VSRVEGLLASPRLLSGLRVLVVDDTADARESVCLFLEMQGAEVRGAVSAAEGLAILGSFRPDVLLLDLTMPHVDGFEMMRRVRRGPHAGVPAIAFSGLSEPEDREQAFEAGFQRFLSKPIDMPRIVDTIIGLTRTKAATQGSAGGRHPPIASIPWTSGLPSLDSLRIMVVEDDRDTLEVIGTLLVGLHAEVSAFDNVEDAFTALASVRPHVVLTDVAMPGTDGVEFLRRIRSRPAEEGGEVPVIALTAYGRQFEGAGFDAVLSKPPMPDRLATVVHAAVRPVDVVLYVTGNEMAEVASHLRMALDRFEPSTVLYRVVDIASAPDLAQKDRVTATPALVRHHPRPEARLGGDLHDADLTASVLERWGALQRHR
jgi:CheY-like chemotaxis protein